MAVAARSRVATAKMLADLILGPPASPSLNRGWKAKALKGQCRTRESSFRSSFANPEAKGSNCDMYPEHRQGTRAAPEDRNASCRASAGSQLSPARVLTKSSNPLETGSLRTDPETQVSSSRLDPEASPFGDVELKPCFKHANKLRGEFMSNRYKDTLAGLQSRTCSSPDGNEDGVQNKQSRHVLQSSTKASRLNDLVHPSKEGFDPDSEEATREWATLEDSREDEEERNEGTSSSRVRKAQAVHVHDEAMGT